MLGQLLKSLLRPRTPPAGAAAARPSTGVDSGFAAHLANVVSAKQACVENDNFDHDRWHGLEEQAREREAGFCKYTVADLLTCGSDYAAVYAQLADSASRDCFVHLLAFRLLGHRHVRLPSNRAEHWEIRARVKAHFPGKIAGIAGEVGRCEVDFAGAHIALEAFWSNIAWTFFLRQYYLGRVGLIVAPRPGDVVIDAGACFGDTALAFAASVGEHGRVLAFEIDPTNAALARRNIAANPELASRIELRECALADSEAPLYLHGSGPGARVSSEPSAHRLAVTTIDRVAGESGVERIDFVKMDIEGAERLALIGAGETLRRFRPRLAISVYHRIDDLRWIPAWLDALGLGYRLYLEHYTIHFEETVLYAVADPLAASGAAA